MQKELLHSIKNLSSWHKDRRVWVQKYASAEMSECRRVWVQTCVSADVRECKSVISREMLVTQLVKNYTFAKKFLFEQSCLSSRMHYFRRIALLLQCNNYKWKYLNFF